jgi:hypothetical protein
MKAAQMAVVLCLVWGAGTLMAADGFASRRQAERLIDLFNLEPRVREIPEAMLQIEMQKDPNISPYADVYRRYFSDALSWDRLKPELVTLFMQEFSNDELKRLVTFFDSEVGQKYLKVASALPRKISVATERLLNSRVATLHKGLEQRRKEIIEGEIKKLDAR